MISKLIEVLVVGLFPGSPKGRKMRINHLIKVTGKSYDFCAAVVYALDVSIGRRFNSEEQQEAVRLVDLFREGKIDGKV